MPDSASRKKGLAPSIGPSDDENTHPLDISESALEKFIKRQALSKGSLLDADMPYLEQYLHPDKDILPKQELRPTIGGTNDLPYRHAQKYTYNMPDMEDTKKLVEKSFSGEPVDFTKVKMVPHSGFNTAGLGRYKFDTSHPDYDSIYDKWDFNTNAEMFRHDMIPSIISPSVDYMTRKFLQMVGKPFNVYERVPKRK